MATTFDQLRNRGAWTELVRLFGNPSAGRNTAADARGTELLRQFGLAPEHIVAAPDPSSFWTQVCTDIAAGLVRDGDLDGLLRLAADVYPGNEAFSAWRAVGSKPGEREGASIQIAGHPAPEAVLALAQRLARNLGIHEALSLVHSHEGNVSINLTQTRSAQAERLARALSDELRSQGVRVRTELHPFRDYLVTQIHAEGPDGQRFKLEDVPGSTRVRDIGQSVVSQYSPEMMPHDREGQPRPVTVDKIEGGKAERLEPDKTVHESGLQDGATVQVAPQRTAGSVNPIIREEALARVRSQIVEFAETHPGFEVEANARFAPTEYTLKFRAPGWAPPLVAGGAPVAVEEHTVELQLSPDFPMVAPLVLWRSAIFHPNVHRQTGKVCLGLLEDGYRPGLNFGELCQFLIDLASYRNYETREGYDLEAQEWAVSREGQMAIESRGGVCVLRMFMDGLREPHPLKIKRVVS